MILENGGLNNSGVSVTTINAPGVDFVLKDKLVGYSERYQSRNIISENDLVSTVGVFPLNENNEVLVVDAGGSSVFDTFQIHTSNPISSILNQDENSDLSAFSDTRDVQGVTQAVPIGGGRLSFL